MCGHRQNHKHAQAASSGPYEGATMRLDGHGEAVMEQSGQRRSWKHVPCWAWWLIWPLIELSKALFRILATAGAAVSDWLAPLAIIQFWPVVLILIGLLLLRQSRR